VHHQQAPARRLTQQCHKHAVLHIIQVAKAASLRFLLCCTLRTKLRQPLLPEHSQLCICCVSCFTIFEQFIAVQFIIL
jgi:hypothetical protein